MNNMVNKYGEVEYIVLYQGIDVSMGGMFPMLWYVNKY